MSGPDWETVAEPTDEAGARIVLGLLESESIPARIKSNVPVPGLPISFQVQVDPAFAERARSLLTAAQPSEDELASLAIASKPPDDA
jgi:hypothetical protein